MPTVSTELLSSDSVEGDVEVFVLGRTRLIILLLLSPAVVFVGSSASAAVLVWALTCTATAPRARRKVVSASTELKRADQLFPIVSVKDMYWSRTVYAKDGVIGTTTCATFCKDSLESGNVIFLFPNLQQIRLPGCYKSGSDKIQQNQQSRSQESHHVRVSHRLLYQHYICTGELQQRIISKQNSMYNYDDWKNWRWANKIGTPLRSESFGTRGLFLFRDLAVSLSPPRSRVNFAGRLQSRSWIWVLLGRNIWESRCCRMQQIQTSLLVATSRF